MYFNWKAILKGEAFTYCTAKLLMWCLLKYLF